MERPRGEVSQQISRRRNARRQLNKYCRRAVQCRALPIANPTHDRGRCRKVSMEKFNRGVSRLLPGAPRFGKLSLLIAQYIFKALHAKLQLLIVGVKELWQITVILLLTGMTGQTPHVRKRDWNNCLPTRQCMIPLRRYNPLYSIC